MRAMHRVRELLPPLLWCLALLAALAWLLPLVLEILGVGVGTGRPGVEIVLWS
jgi:hypothetical protein